MLAIISVITVIYTDHVSDFLVFFSLKLCTNLPLLCCVPWSCKASWWLLYSCKLHFTEAFSLHLNGEGTDHSFNHLKTVLKVCHRQRERTQLKNTLRQVNKLNNSRQWRNLQSIARKHFCLILSSKTSHERLPRKWFKMLRTRTPSELPRARNQILPLSIC